MPLPNSIDRLATSPVIYLHRQFASSAEVDHIVRVASGSLARAEVSGEARGNISPGRSGRNGWFSHDQDGVIAEVTSRMATLAGLPLEHAESLQVIHYYAGEEYAPHFDAWDPCTERGKRCMKDYGQRLVTCLLYLNTVPVGGETTFPKLGLKVPAVAGNLIVFRNCIENSNLRHPDGLHGGLPVSSGEKWACNLWFREKSVKASRISCVES